MPEPRVGAAILVLLALTACRLLTGPSEELRTEVVVEPLMLTLGEPVQVTIIARNEGTRTMESGHGCGPGLGFEVSLPDGSLRYPMREGPWNCPVYDSNIIDPGETDTVTFSWANPPVRGVYSVRGGLRLPTGLEWLSAARTFEVH